MEKKHGAKNKLLAEQRRLSPELISKNAPDSQQKLDAASRAIDDLKSAVAILQKSVSQLQALLSARRGSNIRIIFPALRVSREWLRCR